MANLIQKGRSNLTQKGMSNLTNIFAGAVLIARQGCWSLLSAGYQIQAVPNSVDVRVQGTVGQDIWLHAASIISVPKNLYLQDLAQRTAAVSSVIQHSSKRVQDTEVVKLQEFVFSVKSVAVHRMPRRLFA